MCVLLKQTYFLFHRSAVKVCRNWAFRHNKIVSEWSYLKSCHWNATMQRWQLSKLIEAIELFVIVQNIIMIVLVGWKSLCCFTLSSVFSMWESKFLCGYECHFLDLVGGGCAKWNVCENSLWKQSSTTIYRRHCCLQTLFLLFSNSLIIH